MVTSDVQRVVLAVRQSLPAGGTRVRRRQSISQTLAAEHMTTFGGHDQSAAVYNLQTSTVQSESRMQLSMQVSRRWDDGHLTVGVQTDRTADRAWSLSEIERFPIQCSL